MKKIFISLPMANKTDDEIENDLQRYYKAALVLLPHDDDYELINTFIDELSIAKNQGLWYLGKSFELMADADYVIATPGWATARGCFMEISAAQKYDIPVIKL